MGSNHTVPIPLTPDGHPWRLYEPVPVMRDVRGEDGVEDRMIAWEFGPDLDAETNESLGRGFQKILVKIVNAESNDDRACGWLEAAWFLLARNYEITADEFEDLLLHGGRRMTSDRRRLIAQLQRHIQGITEKVAALHEDFDPEPAAEAEIEEESA